MCRGYPRHPLSFCTPYKGGHTGSTTYGHPTTSSVPHFVSPLPEMGEDAGYADAQDLPNAYDSPLPPKTLPTPADTPPAAPADNVRADDIVLTPTEDTHDTPDIMPPSPQKMELAPTIDLPVASPTPIVSRYPVRERKPPNRLSLTSV